MVNTRADADLSVAVQSALQTLLPQIRGNALAWWKAYKQDKGGDAWLVTVTWANFKKLFFLQFFPQAKQERLKREYHSIRQTNFKKLFFLQFFPRAEQERLKREYHSICQTSTETSTEFMQCFLRLAGFLWAAAGTEEEQAKNFQWGLRRSTLNHLMCMSYTDVAQVANAARNYEILHERDDEDIERPDKRQRSDRRGGSDNHRSSNNNYSGSNNRNFGYGRDQRNRGHQSNRSANSGSQQSRGPSEGYSYPVCTTCGRRHPGECRRAVGTCFKCGQAGHLQKDCKKNTTASTSGQADKKPGASGRVFAITEGHAANTSGTITGTLFSYGHAVFVLFDTGATHSVISSAFASRITTTPMLLDH
nr:zinc finger, CCHC-type, retrotransposon Gag domain protein [Tanacetum cinerariifolium]